uniref:Glycosyltransferase 2-like domain-containing protein n=1 Tax=viral metagenome TaxID=1070528 RepID=A0A6C0D8M4_9ZZZZ
MKVVLGGIVRNIERNSSQILKFLFSLKQELPQLEVCLYENNSNDSTKEFLHSIQNDFIQIQTEDYLESFFLNSFPGRTYTNEGCRIHKIAFARNQLLKMIEKKKLTSEDFVIIMDLDINNPPEIKVIKFIIENFPDEAHVLFANGIQHNGHYYDGYEFRSEQLPYGPEILGETFWSDAHMGKIQKKYVPENSLIPVVSAFGGIAVYRANVIEGCSYSADVTDALHEFYSSLPIVDPTPKTHVDGCSLGVYLKDKNIFYKNNSGYNYPVAAEHVNFHLEIRKKGFTNMFICPFLYYYWG